MNYSRPTDSVGNTDWLCRSAQVPQSENHPFSDERLKLLDIGYWHCIPISRLCAGTLISSFLESQHAILGFFDADLFLSDLVTKKHNYCSPLLVSALLYTASVSHDKQFCCSAFALIWCPQLGYAAIDPSVCTLRHSFLGEAERLWAVEQDRAPLPTVAALNLLAFGCICDGDSVRADQYFFQSRFLADEIGLFSHPLPCFQSLPVEEIHRAQAHAAWGMFAFHT